MSESYFEHNSPESVSERREQLKEGLGVTLCTKQKSGENSNLVEQVALAEEMNIPAVQFDFRDRTTDEILAAKESLVVYREMHPDVAVSIHGENPEVNPSTLDFETKDRTQAELELFQELSGESYTVHPPAINQKIFTEASADAQQKVLRNYAEPFVLAAKQAYEGGKKFSIAIENMPAKGTEGSWGQSVEEVLPLIAQVEQAIVDAGVDPVAAREYVGATLDINHALYGAEEQEYGTILETWFKGLGEYLKVIHLYTPSEPNNEFELKYTTALNLASQFNPNARVFLESKQNAEITKKIFSSLKNIN